jgi:hypothetical protein
MALGYILGAVFPLTIRQILIAVLPGGGAGFSTAIGKGWPMNWLRIGLASVGAFIAYFLVGGLAFGLVPSLKSEFLKFPAVYRPQDGQMSHMPVGMAAIFVGMFSLAVLYAAGYRGISRLLEGVRFGALIGVFAIGAFVVHDYVNLNIGLLLTVQQSVACFAQWVVAGVVIGLIYRPAR